jgi:hypothetical protein
MQDDLRRRDAEWRAREQPAMTMDVYGHLFPSGDDGAELAVAEKAFL